jgi:hypothetical protein
MTVKRIRRKDGVVQRYHVTTRGTRVQKPVVRRVPLMLDRYKNLDFFYSEDPRDELKIPMRVFKNHPEIVPYVVLLSGLASETGGVLDDGYLPPDLQLYLQVPLQDYQLLKEVGILKPVTYGGKKGFQVRIPSGSLGKYLDVVPFKGEKWPHSRYNKINHYIPSLSFMKHIGLYLKKRARINSNKRLKDIKDHKDLIELFSIIPYLLER